MIINNLLLFIGIIGNIIYMFFCLHFLFIFLWHVWLYFINILCCYGMYDYMLWHVWLYLSKNKKPCFDDSSRVPQNTKMNWCDWVIMFMIEWLAMPHTLCPDQGSMVSYSIVLAWSTSARLTGLIRSRNSAYVESNWEPHGHQPNAYTHQPTVVVIISVQMCVYIPLNMWKYQRNRNLKFQKIDPARNRTQVIRVIPRWSYH